METKIATIQPTAVMIRREMVKNPAVMGVLGPIERAVFLASTAKTIAEYSGAELSIELTTALKWICKDVGYRSTDESETQYLVIRIAELLKRYYANLTLKDFRMAFEMSITGELDEFLPRGRDGQADRGHYQQFNAEYVCKILNAYKGRRAWVLKKANDALPKAAPDIAPELKEEYHKAMVREMLATFAQYRDNGILHVSPIAEMLYYNELADMGLVGPVEVTPEEQREIWQRTINSYARNGMIGDINRLKASGPTDPELMDDAYRLARRKALKRAFDDLILSDADLANYIQ